MKNENEIHFVLIFVMWTLKTNVCTHVYLLVVFISQYFTICLLLFIIFLIFNMLTLKTNISHIHECFLVIFISYFFLLNIDLNCIFIICFKKILKKVIRTKDRISSLYLDFIMPISEVLLLIIIKKRLIRLVLSLNNTKLKKYQLLFN